MIMCCAFHNYSLYNRNYFSWFKLKADDFYNKLTIIQGDVEAYHNNILRINLRQKHNYSDFQEGKLMHQSWCVHTC